MGKLSVSNNLKPCECESILVDVEQVRGGLYRAYCFSCGRVGAEECTKEKAINAWNNRVERE